MQNLSIITLNKNKRLGQMKRILKVLKKILPAAVVSVAGSFVCLCIILTVIPGKNENTMNVYDNTIRLRVVANSDSDYDQKLKLTVRDGIIDTAHEIFGECKSRDEARRQISKNMEVLRQKAQEILRENGCDMEVNVRVLTEKVPVRRYSDFVFPAGEYETLRIDLGKAKGKNWWCVMYPPLCVSAATGDVYAETAVFKEHGFTDNQINELRSPDKKIKLAFLEWFTEN